MRLTIARKLWVGFGTLVLILMATGLVAGVGGKAGERLLDRFARVEEPTNAAAYEMEINALGAGQDVLGYLATGEPRYRERMADEVADFERAEARYDRLANTREEREVGDRVASLHEDYRALGDGLIRKGDERSELTDRVGVLYGELDALIDQGVQARLDQGGSNGSRKAQAASAVEVQIAEVGTWTGMFLADPREEYRDRISDNADDFRAELGRLRDLGLSAAEESRAGELEAVFEETEELVGRRLVLESSIRGDVERFQGLRDDIDMVLDEQLQAAARRDLQEAEEAARATFRNVYVATMLLLAVGLLWGSGAAGFISRSIVRAVRPLVEATNRFGEGALNQRVRAKSEDEIGELVTAFNDMASKRQQAEEQLKRQALHDVLTGLANRVLFKERLEQALSRVGRQADPEGVAILFVDLDDFKLVNDSLGHDAGDELLLAAAGRLRALVRPEDTVARLGGDEFALLLEETDLPGAVRVAERAIEVLREPFPVGGHEVVVTPSVGVAVGGGASAGKSRPEDLLHEADLAMYRAKNSGKARYAVFEEGMDERALERLELEHGLRRAMDCGEFAVRYQPQVSLGTGRVVGFEALVRWEHPEKGLLGPEEFVPVAEETGLIVRIGEWVLEEACRQAREWHERYPSYPPPTMCVNLSARQFREPGLAEGVAGVLARTGLEPGRLFLEVTESAAMDDVLTSAATLEELQDLGVRVAIDDFGTGYSSLSYLGRLPVDGVKVDRSFVGGLGEDPTAALLVGGIVELAHALGLTVVAEGVETAGQLRQLKELGCDAAQGNHFSEPVPGEAAAALLRNLAPR